jgi:hypothetical protein
VRVLPLFLGAIGSAQLLKRFFERHGRLGRWIHLQLTSHCCSGSAVMRGPRARQPRMESAKLL